MSLIVNQNPLADAGQPSTVCSGASVTLGGAPAAIGGTGPYGYLWTPGGAAISNPSVNPASNTTYTLQVTDGNGCVATSTVAVAVNANPVAIAGPSQQICIGNTALLGGTPAAAGGTPPYVYLWTPVSSLSNPLVSNPAANPVATQSYTLQVTDANNCSSISTMTLTVNGKPVADAGNAVTIYQGDSTQLSASGGLAYQWTPSASLADPFSPSTIAKPQSTTTYTVTVTDANGCVGYDTVTVHVSIPTGVHGLQAGNVSVAPNPFHIQTQVTLKGDYKPGWSIILLNALGEKVRQYENISDRSVMILRENLTPGVYAYMIQLKNGGTIRGKISVMH
jgi:hypothetical protein